jgi:hypothetical protein
MNEHVWLVKAACLLHATCAAASWLSQWLVCRAVAGQGRCLAGSPQLEGQVAMRDTDAGLRSSSSSSLLGFIFMTLNHDKDRLAQLYHMCASLGAQLATTARYRCANFHKARWFGASEKAVL